MFENFDFADFWNDDVKNMDWIGEPPSDELIAEIEKELGYKLPASYIWLMKQHNGGLVNKTDFLVTVSNSWKLIGITSFIKINSICDENQFMKDDWGYPDIGVAICDTPSAGHEMIFLDYRECGRQGEPKVVHIDQELDYEITLLADNFENFIRGLVNSEELEEFYEE
jgi:hypothetical protein